MAELQTVAAKAAVIALLAGASAGAVTPQTREGWIEGKIQSMSLREKIGQMLMIDLSSSQSLTAALRSHLALGAFGNVIFFERNLVDETQTRIFIRELQDDAVVRTGVSLLTAVDQEGGLVNRIGVISGLTTTRYGARTLGDVFRFRPHQATKLLDRLTADVAARMKDLGFNMNLAPVLDITDDRRSYIYDRSYGGDPESVTRLATSYARLMRQHGVVTTGKHFPNLGTTTQDSHKELPVISRTRTQLVKHELVPFKRLKGELDAVMIGHVLVPDIDKNHPASVSPAVVRTLREQIGFRGVIVSDDLKMKALSDRYSPNEIVLRSVFAGVDLLIVAWEPQKQLEAARAIERAVLTGRLPITRIDGSVRRILAVKYRYAR